MALMLWKRKKPLREDKPLKETTKIVGKVLDDATVSVLVKFINTGVIKRVDYPISSGKEAVVFRATRTDGSFVAIKVFKYETSALRHMEHYIEGDPRFLHVRHQKRSLVRDWAKKEFANLRAAHDAGVRVPEPYKLKENIIVMEFLGEGGVAYALLHDVVLSHAPAFFRTLMNYVAKTYSIGLVHADLSPYNIVVTSNEKGSQKPCIIDWGQAVLLEHPQARAFLERDVHVLCNYFSKVGVACDEQDEVDRILSIEPTRHHLLTPYRPGERGGRDHSH